MKHEFFFYSGLPRSGGTMLASVMNQHPDLHVTPLSPTVELLYYTEKYFDEQSEAYNADPRVDGKQCVLENIARNYYHSIDKKYIMDNNRAWPNNVGRITRFLTKDPKIVCIVRDVPSILASFIDLLNRNNNPGENFVDRWLLDNNLELTTENRCMYLMQPIGIVNQSLWSMYQGFKKGYRDIMHLVEYNDLVNEPEQTLYDITKFLNINEHKFEFNNIVNVTPVNDVTYNLEGMHSVRPKLQDRKLDVYEILGRKLVEEYSGLEYWRTEKPKHKYSIFKI
jgi:sulfotransferase